MLKDIIIDYKTISKVLFKNVNIYNSKEMTFSATI